MIDLLPFAKPRAVDRKAAARRERKQEILERAALRDDVIARSGCRCEACGADLRTAGMVLDHWLGGNGRRKALESLKTLWALCLSCNEKRTANKPNAAHWNKIFERHCERYNYEFTPHIAR